MTGMAQPWQQSSTHLAWLDRQLTAMVNFAQRSVLPGGGFSWLGADGKPIDDDHPRLFLTSRMVHSAGYAHARGVPGAGRLVDHGVESLLGAFADTEHGGWFNDLEADHQPVPGRKMAYDHVQVALAGASALAIGHPRGRELLDRAIAVIEEHIWDPEDQICRESFAADFTDSEVYRGANCNMHATEAFLALGDVTGDPVWHQRALSMADRFINVHARENDWLIYEHFLPGDDGAWKPEPDYNRAEPLHPFRPYGATYGHLLEWARFLVNLQHSPALQGAGFETDWLIEAASGLTTTALDGWAADGNEGLVYTVDWDRSPVADLRLHWPICEGIQAVSVLGLQTGEQTWQDWYRRLWDHAAAYFIDEQGLWRNELTPQLEPSEQVWPGRPDTYHCTGAYAIPTLPLSPFMTLAAVGEESRLR